MKALTGGQDDFCFCVKCQCDALMRGVRENWFFLDKFVFTNKQFDILNLSYLIKLSFLHSFLGGENLPQSQDQKSHNWGTS